MTEPDDGLGATFERHRAYLQGLAYRMLGAHAEAEDAVQESWLRWREADRKRVDAPRAFLAQTVTRLCLDRLKSAQARREVYVGPWLPEPVLEHESLMQPGPESASEFAADLSFAFMLALERLSPLERAAFLMHDVFGADFAEVASALERTPTACRQLASRARTRVREALPRPTPLARETADRLTAAFLVAIQTGDAAALKLVLAADVRMLSDGGGRIAAAGIPVLGCERVAKTLIGFGRKQPLPAGAQLRLLRINGDPGLLMLTAGGEPIQTLSLGFDAEGRIDAVYVVRNPDKLRHLAPGARRAGSSNEA